MSRPTRIAAMFGAIALAGFWVVACQRSADPERLGEPLDPQARAVSISDVLQNPKQYEGQLVVLEGRIGAVGCLDCGGVIVTDKTWRLPVEPVNSQEFRIPVKQGAPIKAWGIVHVEKLGEEKAEGGEAMTKEHEARHAALGLVEVKAYGVEIR